MMIFTKYSRAGKNSGKDTFRILFS